MTFLKFTEPARSAMQHAYVLATEQWRDYPEATEAITLDHIARGAETASEEWPPTRTVNLPHSVGSKRALELTLRIAQRHGHDEITLDDLIEAVTQARSEFMESDTR